MATMLIAQNETRESGSFMGDQLCSLKAAYLFAEHAPPGTDKFIMSVSPGNEMAFLWDKFIAKYNIELVVDNWNPGDWGSRWLAWDKWRTERNIEGKPFDHYRELYLRIHGAQRQQLLCGSEYGLGRRNIYGYWWCGQEGCPEELPPSVDWFDDTLVHHPPHIPTRDVYIAPHAKTQGNYVFTFQFWADVVHRLIDAGVTVTVGYDGSFCAELEGNSLFKRHWAGHREWMDQICAHKLVACGNTGTGWLASACGVPMITMEPLNSQMPDHRYGRCGLRNIVEIVAEPDAAYVARRIIEQVQRCVVMTTGCYDILHAGHVRHLERSRALGTKLIVALNSDTSVRALKGNSRPINPQEQRKAVLEALRCVDEVRIFDGANAIPLMHELKPNILTNGYGYNPDDIVGRDIIETWGGRAVITCRGDAKNEPSTTKIAQRMRATDIIELCTLGASYSCNPFDKMRLLADQLLSVKELPGDMADLGTYRGGAALVMRRLVPDKHLHLFDTWAGNPYDDPLCHHKRGEWQASLEDCQKLVGAGDLTYHTYYHQGIFPQSMVLGIGGGGERSYCFVFVDMDTEQATRDAIELFWPRMVPGGKMVFDDYNWEPCAGVKKAVDEVFPDGASKFVLPQIHTCVVTKT